MHEPPFIVTNLFFHIAEQLCYKSMRVVGLFSLEKLLTTWQIFNYELVG